MQHHPGDDIGVFLTVCEAGSFVAASQRLGLSPSAVAKAIARLEARLSVRLLQRTTRSLSVTQEGQAYRDVCRSARQDVERIEMAMRTLSDEPAGLVRVSLPPLFGAQVIAPALFQLSRNWPHLRYSISASTAQSALLDGDVDLAVRIGEVPDVAGLMTRYLGRQDIVLCGSEAYFSRHSRPRTTEDLRDLALIGTVRNGKASPWHFRQTDGTVLSWTPDARLLLNGSLLTLAAIREGYGLGLVPRWLVEEDLRAGHVTTVLEESVSGHLPVHVLWPASPVMLSRIRVTIDAIVASARSRLA
ncbi:LysR family transcriptional regulator [Aquamicrobium lusatiense]|uniref:LysR family transcriptional regulator n=1 Tax=Aquamicrobium lusatiense TaxID=89772 RepID=UPI002458EFE2|nr:LysR family transcriptional regulator [Aquamicrobium lusatiense]MDH4989932.1 LysR family transcriptional regulator [Aquamicrobium lusatiense]